MNKTDNTLQLIKSLTQNEKRAFRLFAGLTTGKKNYMRVFGILETMKEYDPAKLKKKTANLGINIAHEKNYLETILLRSLRNFHSDDDELTRLRNQLINIDILYRKRLHAHVEKALHKAKLVAEKFEYWTEHLVLIDQEYKYYTRTGRYDKLAQFSDEALALKIKLVNNLSSQSRIQALVYRIIFIYRTKGNSMNAAEKKEFLSLYNACEKMLPETQHSFLLTELLLSYLYISATFLNKHHKALAYCHQLLEEYRQKPHFMTEFPGKYFALLANMTARLFNLKKYNEALALADESQSFCSKLKTMKQNETFYEMFAVTWETRIKVYLATGNYEAAVSSAIEFDKGWNYKNTLLRNNSLWFTKLHVTRAFFFGAHFKKARQEVSAFINHVEFGNMQQDMIEHAYLLRLMIYYELREFRLLENLCRNTLYLFRKNGKDEFAEQFVIGIKNASNTCEDAVKTKKIFLGLDTKLSALKTRLTMPEDFLLWIRSKYNAFGKKKK